MLDTHIQGAGWTYGIDNLQQVFDTSACALDYHLIGPAANEPPQLRRVHLGGVDVYRLEGHALRGARRSYNHIRSDHVDDFLISVPVSAPIVVSQSGCRSRVEPGALAFMATGRPFEAYGEAGGDNPVDEIIVRISGPLLRARVTHIDMCCSKAISIRTSAGRILQTLLELALHEGEDLSSRYGQQFGGIVLDTIATTILEAPELCAATLTERVDPQERLRQQATAYITTQLSRSDLCVREIADHCRVSVRYLHAAFASSSMTVGEVIRELRLQNSRAALRNAALHGQTITEIIMRWGFDNSGSFSRLYKARFGTTPRDDRQEILAKAAVLKHR